MLGIAPLLTGQWDEDNCRMDECAALVGTGGVCTFYWTPKDVLETDGPYVAHLMCVERGLLVSDELLTPNRDRFEPVPGAAGKTFLAKRVRQGVITAAQELGDLGQAYLWISNEGVDTYPWCKGEFRAWLGMVDTIKATIDSSRTVGTIVTANWSNVNQMKWLSALVDILGVNFYPQMHSWTPWCIDQANVSKIGIAMRALMCILGRFTNYGFNRIAIVETAVSSEGYGGSDALKAEWATAIVRWAKTAPVQFVGWFGVENLLEKWARDNFPGAPDEFIKWLITQGLTGAAREAWRAAK